MTKERYGGGHDLDVLAQSRVQLSLDTRTSSHVVIKTHPRRATTDDLTQEIATHAILGAHDHLVTMLDHFVVDGSAHIVLEYCNGGDLLTRLQRQQRFSPTDAMALGLDVAKGLACMHKHGVAHRDVSLENVFLHEGKCKLGDFGLSTELTTVRGTAGKLMYMAPEVATGHAAYDPKAADVWSLGIVLFIMLTGVPLFSVAAKSDKLFRAVHRQGLLPVLRICQKKGFMTPAISDVLLKMLVVAPSQRMTSEDVVHALEGLHLS
ncbi:serine/threonine protein kinase [Saprolegnia diclina VS20]|uniref:Serine/threonine protein kinase n=1 Tax=Saprolegnia diclina (strain VS20) TaxID=1156394 RepID=T0RKC4_SAPDV|nr:serine/threonine protein kinase [Saprolegnia diclina VS20]EQC30417.1 serine/threonine protein kinase [Saprolegnia diclina VS20]|eukprot:XP_008616270.1 serine/threonine protein kinase [Saprolegnia diclina VS20]